MATRRYKKINKSKTKKNGGKAGKKWTTAISAAKKTLNTTKSLRAAKKSLNKQALFNARKLFGSI
jgi:hypothetical protein